MVDIFRECLAEIGVDLSEFQIDGSSVVFYPEALTPKQLYTATLLNSLANNIPYMAYEDWVEMHKEAYPETYDWITSYNVSE